MLQNLSSDKQAYLSRLLEASRSQPSVVKPSQNSSNVSPSARPKFRYHKNLATSRYDEFLAESDDEEFFNSKPVTKKGGNYELDFKIDTFRDEI